MIQQKIFDILELGMSRACLGAFQLKKQFQFINSIFSSSTLPTLKKYKYKVVI